jgi:predicted ribosome quality control (RQC) complex YloA/Tae2 family protein
MNNRLLALIVEELAAELRGRSLGKVWQLSRSALAADFRGGGGRTLLISVDPLMPRLYLGSQKVRELERQSLPPSNFVLTLRKRLAGAPLRSVGKDGGERVARFTFEAWGEAGEAGETTLVAQLTGRSSNLLLLDDAGRIIDALRPPRGAGQEVGETYQPPPRSTAERVSIDNVGGASADEEASIRRGSFPTLSAALEDHYLRVEAARDFDARVSSARTRLRQEIAKRRKLERNLARDALAHGDAEEHRRAGDLLLANLSTAERAGSRVRLTDYFAEGAPTVELEIDENVSLQEEAARRFARYSRAKRAAHEIARRREGLRADLSALEAQSDELERASVERDAGALAAFESKPPKAKGGARQGGTAQSGAGRGGGREKRTKRKGAGEPPAKVRRYRSSDGYEILVGRAASDNDELTFRVARSHDLWLHAADYPGSHVVVRARGRDDDVPHRTLVEAAQLAAHFSRAKGDAKVAVHHTRRKFVSKMKGAAPGLVRLASFRTILVEPREAAERI